MEMPNVRVYSHFKFLSQRYSLVDCSHVVGWELQGLHREEMRRAGPHGIVAAPNMGRGRGQSTGGPEFDSGSPCGSSHLIQSIFRELQANTGKSQLSK